jgi:hypothetical protein
MAYFSLFVTSGFTGRSAIIRDLCSHRLPWADQQHWCDLQIDLRRMSHRWAGSLFWDGLLW